MSADVHTWSVDRAFAHRMASSWARAIMHRLSLSKHDSGSQGAAEHVRRSVLPRDRPLIRPLINGQSHWKIRCSSINRDPEKVLSAGG